MLAKLGEHGGVERVGLGQATLGAGEVAHAARVDDGHGPLRRLQCRDHRLFVAAGRFADDVNAGPLLQPPQQRAMPLGLVGELAALRPGGTERTQIQGGFGDIQADIDNGLRHG